MAITVDDRSISDLFLDILRDVREMVRLEFSLVKTELTEQAAKSKSVAFKVGIGAVGLFIGVIFALGAVVLALSRIMPDWAAALTVGGAVLLTGALLVASGSKEWRKLRG